MIDLNNIVDTVSTVDNIASIATTFDDMMQENEYDLQQDAYDELNADMDGARSKAAADVAQENESNIVAKARQMLAMGANVDDVTNYVQETPRVNVSQAVNWGLEHQAALSNEAQAFADNEELRARSVAEPSADVLNNMVRVNANRKVLKTKLAQARAGLADAPLSSIVINSAERFIPFVQQYKDAKVVDEDASAFRLPSQVRAEQQKVIESAAANMDTNDFSVFLNSIDEGISRNTTDPFTRQDYWEDMQTENSYLDDAITALDVASVPPVVKSLTGKLISAGNKAKAVERVETLMKSGNAGSDEVLAATTPSFLQPASANYSANISTDVEGYATKLAIDNKAAEDFLNVIRVDSPIGKEDMQRNFEIFKDGVQNQYNLSEARMKHVNVIFEDADNNAVITIGNGLNGDKGFVAKDAAERFAEKHFIKGDYNIEEMNGTYFVKAKVKVPDLGVELKDRTWEDRGKPFKAKTAFRLLAGRLTTPDDFQRMDVVAGRSKEAAQRLLKPLQDSVNTLNKEEDALLDTLLKLSDNDEQWFDNASLRALGANDKVVKAYEAHHTANDLLYLIENRTMRTDLDRGAYKVYKIDNSNIIARQEPFVKDPSKTTFKDLTDGTYYGPGEMTTEKLKASLGADKVLLRKRSAEQLDINNPAKYVIVSRDAVKSEELPQFVIKYVAGPRRVYSSGTYFAKNARTANIHGQRIMLRPRTLFADTDKASVVKKADEINAMLRVYRDYKAGRLSADETAATINRLSADNTFIHMSGLKEFEENYITNYKLDYFHDIEVVENGVELKDVTKAKQEGIIILDDADDFFTSSLQDMLDDNGRSFNSRGKHLTTADGNPTPVVSPKRLMQKNLNKMIYMNTFADYNKWYARQIKENFWDVIEPSQSLRGMSDVDVLKSVRLIDTKGLDKKTRNKVNAAQNLLDTWRRRSNQTTEWDNMVTTYATALADALGKKLSYFQRGKSAWETVANAKPDDALRNWTFHMYLGCFNPRQLWLQALGTSNLLLLEPKRAMKAVGLYGPLRSSFVLKDPENVSKLAKAALKLTGTPVEDFKDIVKIMHRMNVNVGEGLQSAMDASSVMSASKFAQASTFFFREGERFNFVSSNVTALLRYSEETGRTFKQILNSTDDMKEIMRLSEDLYLNMSKASESAVQHGIGRIPTQLFAQFTAYPIRFIEALMGKYFTTSQKVRLLAGNIAMYGIAGTTGLNVYSELTGEDRFDPKTAEIISTGLIDAMFREAGVKITLSDTGPRLLDTFTKVLTKEGAFDIISSVPSVNAVKSMGSMAELLYRTSKAFYPNSDDYSFSNELAWIAQESALPTSLRNATRAIIAWKTNKIYSSKYDLLSDKVGSLESVMYALGFTASERTVISKMYEARADINNTIQECLKDCEKAYKKWYHTQDDAAWREYQNLYTLCAGSMPDTNSLNRFNQGITNIYQRNVPVTLPTRLMSQILREQGVPGYDKQKQRLEGSY